MSSVGLTALVSQGYARLGIVGIFVMIIPCLTFIWVRNNKNYSKAVDVEEAGKAD